MRVEAERPRAPWGSFPLSELAVLLGLALAALAVAWWGTVRGLWLVGAAVALGALAGLEIAVREHFAGYRSHAGLLAGAVAMSTSVPAALLMRLSPGWVGALCVAALALAWVPLRRTYVRRSGRR